jgi:PAS domain S-box-containing protein
MSHRVAKFSCLVVGFSTLRAMAASRAAVLADSEERFRILVESVRDYGIFMLSPTGHVETWNLGAERLKGYSAKDIIGRHFSVFYEEHEVRAGKCDMELEGAARDGRFEDEGWRLRKDGTRFWANVVITALRDATGTLIGFAKVTRDLSDRRAAEEEARRYRLLVESVKDYAIFILTPEGKVDTWNLGAQRLKGYTAKEIIGKHFSIFYPQVDILAGKTEHELRVATEEGRFEEEGWRIRKDGSRMWANVTITALRDASGTLIGFAKVTRDLTERREAEEQLRNLIAEKASLAEKARLQDFHERFVAILGHDLRNPLASIDMGASLLRTLVSVDNFDKRDDAARIVDRMSVSARRMSRMIEQILDLTRTRFTAGFEIKPTPMDLADALRDVVEEIGAAHPQREIRLSAEPLPGSWDGDRLEQVFSNLVGNAIQYGDPTRPISVDAHRERAQEGAQAGAQERAQGKQGARVVVDVHNHGPAIPDALRERIFDAYRRGERDSRNAATAGLGLGLHISRELVVAHGGDITVSSSDAEGTTFRVTLPMFVSASARRRDTEGVA